MTIATATASQITVYSAPSCMQCTATTRTLDKMGVAYDVVDISQDDASREAVKALGYSQAPVVVSGEDHWSGFRPDLLQSSVKKLALV